MYQASGGRKPLAAGVIEQEASRPSKILCNPYSAAIHDALTYALRELIRNVVEHAMAPHLWLAGMTWPKRDYVQIAKLDEGRGIRQSLSDLPDFRFPTDERALREALRLGVTRNRDRKHSHAEIEQWAAERHILPLSFSTTPATGFTW